MHVSHEASLRIELMDSDVFKLVLHQLQFASMTDYAAERYRKVQVRKDR